MLRRDASPSVIESFRPIRVLELELEHGLPDLPAPTDEQPHDRALALVRLHDEPLGLVEVDLGDGGAARDDLAAIIWERLGREIRAHLRSDGLSVTALRPDGLTLGGRRARCQEERDRFLQDAPNLTVLIPSRERPERLRRCAESILASAYPSDRLRIIVADNVPVTGSTRALVDDLAAKSGGRVGYVKEDAPGSASARNRGLSLVDTEIVAMTDDDVVVDRHWLTEIARAFSAHPAAGAVSGLLWPTELETPAQVWFEQYGGFSRGFDRRVFDLGANRPKDEPLYPWNAGLFGTGNNFSFRTKVLREIGGFDPALGNGTPALGGVDSEVLLRTILSGYQIAYEPRAITHHAHRPDYEALRRQIYAYGVGLVAYYLKTVFSDPRYALDFARKLPAGIRWMLSPDAHINKHKLDDYPSELTWLERRGMLYGPLAYARSRRRYGPHRVYHASGRHSKSPQVGAAV